MAISLRWLIPVLLVAAIAPAAAQRAIQPIRTYPVPTGVGAPGPGTTQGPDSLTGSFGNVGSAPDLRGSGLSAGTGQVSGTTSEVQYVRSDEEKAAQYLEEYASIEGIIGHTPIIKKMYQVRP